MRYNDLISFLNEVGASPKKSLSQNFLIDSNVVKKIIQTADVKKGDVILEIGPGPGALTSALLETGASVFAIEKDAIFANSLTRFQTPDQRLNVYHADALEFPIHTIAFNKVVANLPYHITTPLLEKFFTCKFDTLTLMVQKEFAQRMLAKPKTKEFGSLTLFTQFYSYLKNHFHVSPHCFYPKPSVDSTVIHLQSHPPALDSPNTFFSVMHKAFQQRRKTLGASLKELASTETIRNTLKAINIREDARPEMLSLDQWLSFSVLLSTK